MIPIYYFDELDSTNNYLKEHIHSFQLPIAVTSTVQTFGRGRLGNKWLGNEESLYLSIAIDISCYSYPIFYYPYLASLIVFDAIKKVCHAEIKIKWPNDIVIHKQKVAGILIESIDSKLIIGIGINMFQNADFFKINQLNATSLAIEGSSIEKREFLDLILMEIESKIVTDSYSSERLFKEYLANCQNYKQTIQCRVGKTHETGLFDSLNADGSLSLLKPNGERLSIYSGEIIE